MFFKKLKDVITKQSLYTALKFYKSHFAYQDVKSAIDKGLDKDIVNGAYIPSSAKEFDLKKSGGGKRTILVASLQDRVIAKSIVLALEEEFKFSNRAYAYRKNKGPLKAIRRVLDDINKGNKWVLRTDIESFFDKIDQKLLSNLLQQKIKNPQLISLIILLVTKGSIRKNRYIEHNIGIGQGDPLSPFLSNLFLDNFDKILESKNIPFVRYGDDIILLAKNKETVNTYLPLLKKELSKINLTLKEEKTNISNIKYGFEYMGLFIHLHTIRVETSRLHQKTEAIKEDTKRLNFYDTIKRLNEKIDGFLRYYKKLITDFTQAKTLQDALDEVIIQKIVQAKSSGKINRQNQFKSALKELKNYLYTDEFERTAHYKHIITKAYDTLKSQKDPLKNAKDKLERKKQQILQSNIKASELIVAKPGLYIGFSRGKVTLKEFGKVIKTTPINRLRRVIVMQRCSISSEVIYQCTKRQIDIDFLKHTTPYAQITPFKSIAHTLARKQTALQQSPLFLQIAKEIVKTKIKNQINLLKYYAKYRKKSIPQLYTELKAIINKISKIYIKIDTKEAKSQLLGLEGSASALYWNAFGLIIGKSDYQRYTQDAPDAINQALNYGYAILYHRVQSALLKANLDIYSSIFHEIAKGKPTLVFDVIEEFRQPIVDREIIASINKGFEYKTNKGRLTKKSLQEVVENIQKRLATPTKYHGSKHQLSQIIELQAYALARAIDKEKKYHGFTARY